MSAHAGRIDENLLESFIVSLWYPLPESLPDVALLPTAKAVIDGIPMAECIGQVPPWESGTRLVENGFDEPPVAEHRGAAGRVFDLTQ